MIVAVTVEAQTEHVATNYYFVSLVGQQLGVVSDKTDNYDLMSQNKNAA